MEHILSEKIVRAIIKEERETAERYMSLGRKYQIPELVKAGKEEAQHSKLFERILWAKYHKKY